MHGILIQESMLYFQCILYIHAVCPLLFAVQHCNVVQNKDLLIFWCGLEEWCQVSIWMLCKYNFLQYKDKSQDCQQPTNLDYLSRNVTGHLAFYTVDSIPVVCICSDCEWSTVLPRDGKCFELEPSKHTSRSYELPKFTRGSYGSCRAEAAMVSNSLSPFSCLCYKTISSSFLLFCFIRLFQALHDWGWAPTDHKLFLPCHPDQLQRQCSKAPPLQLIRRHES